MKKRSKFIISLILVIVLTFSALCLPAASFTNDVETSTNDILLVNLDTHTTVYSKKPDNMWYSGNLAELMTFLVAYENLSDPEDITFEVEQSFITALPYSDGCLDKFVGQTLTAVDLMAIMLLTSGNDAAYALADLVTDKDRDAFVAMMNERAQSLNCKNTGYINPGFSDKSDQYTTCNDVMRLYTAVKAVPLYDEIMSNPTYTPAGLDKDEYSVTTDASILNDKSPYYFKYCNDAKFSYTTDTYAELVATTTYHGKTYLFVGLVGLNEAERNVFADARKLTTWAYLNLSDRKVINSDDSLTKISVNAGWGNYDMELYAFDSAYKTLPNEFDEVLLSYSIDTPESIKWPQFEGGGVGTAKVTYGSEVIDNVDLVLSSDEGVDLLHDVYRFGSYVFKQMMPVEPAKVEQTVTETATTATEG